MTTTDGKAFRWPKWMDIASDYIGTVEISGPKDNPKVVELWKKAHVPGVDDDETPWCAAFVSAVLEDAGIVSARTGWARGYLKWGVGLDKPALGCVVVFSRGKQSGHVGFIAGKDRNGNIMVLGGNQSDAVNIKPFSTARVLGYRWPTGVEPPPNDRLPTLNSDGRLSTNEA